MEQPAWFSKVPEEILNSRGFSHKVWRLQISYSMLSYLGVETFGDAIRPPTREEKPRLKYFAYGSSITHSFAGGYPYLAARKLGVDVLNK
ncbi:hypothetical protein RZS08_17840, partial [Arthrospira platensis SPKY1]|nr:hypothetical protein [Arthrospira platensis SPKY1]